MADLAIVRNGKSLPPTMPPRSPLAEWFGVDSFDLFRNFYSPQSLDMGLAQGGIDITRNESGYAVEIPVAGYKPDEIQVTCKTRYSRCPGRAIVGASRARFSFLMTSTATTLKLILKTACSC